MDKNASKALDLPANVNRIKALGVDQSLHFAMTPNNNDPYLVISRKTLTLAKFTTTLKGKQSLIGEVDVSTVYVGQIKKTGKKAFLHLDAEKSKGALSDSKMLKLFKKLGKDLKLTPLTAVKLPAAGVNLETSASLTSSKMSTILSKEGGFARINDRLKKLRGAESRDDVREQSQKLMAELEAWKTGHDGRHRDQDERKRAKIAEVEAGLLGQLQTTLRSLKEKPTAAEKAFAERMLSARIAALPADASPDDCDRLIGELKGWKGLLKLDAQISDLQRQKQEHIAAEKLEAAKQQMSAARKLRRADPKGLDLTGEGVATVTTALDAMLDSRLLMNDRALAEAKALVKLLHGKARRTRDAALLAKARALKENIQLQESLSSNPDHIKTTGEAGLSGSYFIKDSSGTPVGVYKPMFQENHSSDPSQTGQNTRGEILGSSLAGLMEEELGIDIGVPRTRIVSLGSDTIDSSSPLKSPESRESVQLGSFQELVSECRGGVQETWSSFVHPDLPFITHPNNGTAGMDNIMRAAASPHTAQIVAYYEQRDGEVYEESSYPGLVARAVDEAFDNVVYQPPPGATAQLVKDTQSIAILDMVSLQADRNPGNLLISGSGDRSRIVPIDQGESVPSINNAIEHFSAGKAFIAWRKLPFADHPFPDELKQKVALLDPDDIVEKTRQTAQALSDETGGRLPPLPEENLVIQKLSILTMKAGTAKGLSPKALAGLYEKNKSGAGVTLAPFCEMLEEIKTILTRQKGLLLGRLRPEHKASMLAELISEKKSRVYWNAKATIADKSASTLKKDVDAVLAADKKLRRIQAEIQALRAMSTAELYTQLSEKKQHALLSQDEHDQAVRAALTPAILQRLFDKHITPALP